MKKKKHMPLEHDDLTGVKTRVNNAQWKIKIKQRLNKF